MGPGLEAPGWVMGHGPGPPSSCALNTLILSKSKDAQLVLLNLPDPIRDIPPPGPRGRRGAGGPIDGIVPRTTLRAGLPMPTRLFFIIVDTNEPWRAPFRGAPPPSRRKMRAWRKYFPAPPRTRTRAHPPPSEQKRVQAKWHPPVEYIYATVFRNRVSLCVVFAELVAECFVWEGVLGAIQAVGGFPSRVCRSGSASTIAPAVASVSELPNHPPPPISRPTFDRPHGMPPNPHHGF